MKAASGKTTPARPVLELGFDTPGVAFFISKHPKTFYENSPSLTLPMANFFTIVFLLSFPFGIVGLIKPSWFKMSSRKKVLFTAVSTTLVSFIGLIFTIPKQPNTPINTEVKQEIVSTENGPATTTEKTAILGGKVAETSPKITTSTDQKIAKATEPKPPSPVSEKTVVTNSPAATQAESTPPAEPQAQPAPQQPPETYSILKVVDGDTVKVSIAGTEETLRLIGMDTPETLDPRKPVQCFGVEASNKAKELLTNRRVTIEFDASQGSRDKYGRLLAYIRRDDGLFYNKYMIEEGYAHEYTYNLPYKYQTEFKDAQRAAQAAQKGLWSPNTCNGDTTQAAVAPTQPTPSPTAQTTTQQAAGNFYTSSYYSSKYYYPASCSGWQSLSPKYLRAFDTLPALLAAFPGRTQSPQCP